MKNITRKTVTILISLATGWLMTSSLVVNSIKMVTWLWWRHITESLPMAVIIGWRKKILNYSRFIELRRPHFHFKVSRVPSFISYVTNLLFDYTLFWLVDKYVNCFKIFPKFFSSFSFYRNKILFLKFEEDFDEEIEIRF